MKWFKRLLRENSANHCSPAPATTTTISAVIANQCLYRNDILANGSAIDNDDARSSSAIRSNAQLTTRTMAKRRGVNVAFGSSQRAKRRCTNAPHRSASRLLAQLEDGSWDAHSKSTSSVVVHKSSQRLVDPDDFFEDPDVVQSYCAEKKWLAEWCIVEEYLHIGLGSDEDDDDPDGLYATTVFSECPAEPDTDVDDDSFVTVPRTPSVISLSTYNDDSFGIFYGSCHGSWTVPKVPEAYYYYSMEYDIQSGLPMDPAVSAFEEIMVETLRLRTNEELMAVDKPSSMAIADGGPPPPVPKDSLEIAKMFCLSEYGSICLNMDHIREERGYGFLMRRSQRLYRNVEWGRIACEQKPASFVRRMLVAIMRCLRMQSGEFWDNIFVTYE